MVPRCDWTIAHRHRNTYYGGVARTLPIYGAELCEDLLRTRATELGDRVLQAFAAETLADPDDFRFEVKDRVAFGYGGE